jgi:methyl-accepting chemotaxis protein
MAQKLSGLIADMAYKAQSLAAHSEELAASGEEVNATVEEVASTANEVASTATAGFENAQRAVVESQKVGQVAQAGNETVKQTVAKIDAIASSTAEVAKSIQDLHELSSRIGKITNVITGIAEQTNLLALNAAIEAARAGEHGRGFAVVADEVRKLAEQSANATNEINELINQVQVGIGIADSTMQHGVKEVEDGVQLASEAGQALANIIASINEAVGMIEDIQEGSKQESEGMEQVAASNEQITSTTQQIAAATQELAQIANQMQVSVAEFKVAEISDVEA